MTGEVARSADRGACDVCDARTIEMDVSSKVPPPPLARSPSPTVAGEAGKRRIYNIDVIEDSVVVIEVLKPIYNFKAG